MPRPPLGILFNPSASSDALPGRTTCAPWKDRPRSSYGGVTQVLAPMHGLTCGASGSRFALHKPGWLPLVVTGLRDQKPAR